MNLKKKKDILYSYRKSEKTMLNKIKSSAVGRYKYKYKYKNKRCQP